MSKKLKTALIGAVVAGSVLGVVGICSAVNAEIPARQILMLALAQMI